MQEGVYAFAAVGMMQVLHKVIALVVQLLAQGAGRRFVDQLFDTGQRIRCERIEASGQTQGFAKRVAFGYNAVHHAKGLQPLGTDALPAHQQFAGKRPGQRTRKAPAAATIGRQGDLAV